MLHALALLAGTAWAGRTVPPDHPWMHAGEIGWEVGASVEYGFMPDFVLSLLFDEFQSIQGVDPGVEVALRRGGFLLMLQADVLIVTTPAGVWLEKGKSIPEAVWVEQDLKLLTTTIHMGYAFRLGTRRLELVPGIGFGPTFVLGSITEYPTVGPDDDLDARVPQEGAKGRVVSEIPGRAMPAHLLLRGRTWVTPRVALDLDVSIRATLLFNVTAGLGTSFRF